MRKTLLHYQPLFTKNHLFLSIRAMPIALMLMVCVPTTILCAQEKLPVTGSDFKAPYDEIPVSVLLDGYSGISLNAVYTDDNLLFINIEEFFKKLKLNCSVTDSGDSISGFVANEKNEYLVNYQKHEITVSGKNYPCGQTLRKEMGILYLESSSFANLFGLSINFNFRSLTCAVKCNFELPVMKEMRLEKMHNNLSKIHGEIKPDTIVKRTYHLFKFGVADWGFSSTQTWGEKSLHRFNLALGAELLHGETEISYNYSNQYGYNKRQLNYLWRWVNNDNKLVKQAAVGKISCNSISFINAPIVGAVIRNTPTTLRKASGYYTINERTEPNWTVELYINNQLVDYTKADASGNFIFKVPIVFGFTTLRLKYYGPMGEERMDERTFNTPFTLLPTNEFEYAVTGGVIEDSLGSRIARGEINYGVNRFVTAGAGWEYVSSVRNAPSIPFAKLSFQPFSKLLLNVDYAFRVKAHALLNYYVTRNSFLEVDYIRYKEGQQATPFNFLQQVKAKFNVPFRLRSLGGNATVDYSRTDYKYSNNSKLAFSFSAYYRQYTINSSTEVNRAPLKTAFANYTKSILAISFRLKRGFFFRPAITYNLTEKNIMQYDAALEKRIKNGMLSVSYQKFVPQQTYNVGLNVRYDLRFIRTGISAIISRKTVTTTQSAQGSLAFNAGNNFTYASKFTAVSHGGIAVYPFLDLNANGIFDKNEHLVKLNSLKAMSSNVIFSDKDSIIRIPNLYAFTNYNLQFNDHDLENIAWRFKAHIYQVLVDPDQFKRLDIPVMVMGEATGMTYMNNNNILNGIGRIQVNFYKAGSQAVIAQTLSETDGYVQYLGLEPGEYTARIDSAQLQKLKLSVTPAEINFTIRPNESGDIFQMGNFILNKTEALKAPAAKND